MKKVDIIIPVHEYNDDVKSLLTRCLLSIKDMSMISKDSNILTDLTIVGPNLPIEDVTSLVEWSDEFASFNVVDNTTEETDFCSQVNLAVNKCKNDYFMVVEYDDMVTPKWFTMAAPYVEKRKNVSIFLPLVELYDINNMDMPTGYVNELAWSSSFAQNELGVLDLDALKEYCNFNLTGALIKRSDFLKAGGLKPSIKLSFNYELLLRMANLYGNVFVIPKVGYYHFIGRPGSLTNSYHLTMSQQEGAWWISLAGQEYHFKKDRKKEYSPEE
jgi:hypothetical protein